MSTRRAARTSSRRSPRLALGAFLGVASSIACAAPHTSPPTSPSASPPGRAPAASAAAADRRSAAALHKLFQDRYDWEMREFPEEAMRRGDYTHADRLTDNSLAAIERRNLRTLDDLERLAAIDRGGLDEDDLVSCELFQLRLENEVADHRFHTYEFALGQREGPHQTIAEMAERVRFRSQRDYENYLSRLEQTPQYVASAIECLRAGLAEGRTPPKVTLAGLSGQFDALLDGGGLDDLAAPFDAMPDTIPPLVQDAIRVRFETTAAPAARAAVETLAHFALEEYAPGCRASIAATSLPDGEAFYAHQLWKMTTTRMTAQQIFDLGRSEVRRIRAEMMEAIRRSDYLELHPSHADLDDEALFKEFIAYLRTDPRFYHETEKDLLVGYRDICKRVDARLPKFFGVLPRLPYGVRKIPDFMAPQQTTAYYSFGNMKNGEPGYFYANTYALDQRPRYEMIALAMHESVPGHHLQTAIAQELEDVPEFRKNMWFTAFGEGWALYSERLGIEMGLYKDPYDDFGRLLYEMWRACRLVVDPGMHALGWSREDAVAFMLENTALSELNIENEVDRYIAWPGQACAYKIGELKIRALRSEAEKALGEGFDIRAFHDVVLGAGSVPLPVLERRVHEWMGTFPVGAAYD